MQPTCPAFASEANNVGHARAPPPGVVCSALFEFPNKAGLTGPPALFDFPNKAGFVFLQQMSCKLDFERKQGWPGSGTPPPGVICAGLV